MNRIAYSCWSYVHSNGAVFVKAAAFDNNKSLRWRCNPARTRRVKTCPCFIELLINLAHDLRDAFTHGFPDAGRITLALITFCQPCPLL
ncbi:hypothetical protein CWS02_11635 [Enterobacter sp. EA-1]|nr:hypothetical protein CWS02_11635 [Enterobacter sp. EA-1]